MKNILCSCIIFLLISASAFTMQVAARDITEPHEIEFPATETTRVFVHNIDGEVQVDSWDYDFISLHYDLTTSEEYGRSEFDKVELSVTEIDDQIIIETIYLENNVHVDVKMRFEIPHFVSFEHIETINGNIIVYDLNHESYDRSSLTAITTNGWITVNDLIITEGNLSLSTENGDLSVYDATVSNGCVSIDTEKGDISLHDLYFDEGCLSIDTNEGYIYLNDIIVPEGDLSLQTNSGDLTIYDVEVVDGGINMQTGDGDISIHDLALNADGLSLENNNGDLYIYNITNPSGDISLESTDYDISLHDIHIPQGDLAICTQAGEIYCNDVFVDHGDVSLISQSADIMAYDVIVSEGSLTIDTESGAVTVYDVFFELGGLSIHTTDESQIHIHDLNIPHGGLDLSTESGDITIYSLSTPNGTVSMDTISGDVSVHDTTFPLGGVEIETSEKGSVYLNDVIVEEDDMYITSENGCISVYDTIVSGGLYLESNSGEITVYECEFSKYSFTTMDGDFYLNELTIPTGSLTLTTNGDIIVYDTHILDGGIYLETETGDITARNIIFNDFSFNTTSGDIYVGGFTLDDEDLSLTTTGNIAATDVTMGEGNVHLNTEEGDLHISSLDLNNRDIYLSTNGFIAIFNSIATIHATTGKGDIYIRNTSYISELISEKGSIESEILQINDDIEISTKKGTVVLEIDPDINADITASIDAYIGGIFLTNLRRFLTIQQSSLKSLQATLGSGGNSIDIHIGDDNNPSQIFGGFITLKKLRTPLFPLSLLHNIDFTSCL